MAIEDIKERPEAALVVTCKDPSWKRP